MTDIVDRLRGPAPSIMAMRDGAGEIDHLRYLVEAKDAQIKALTEALKPILALSPECVNALTHKTQIDDGGVMVGVSHQAVDEIYAALASARAALAGTEG